MLNRFYSRAQKKAGLQSHNRDGSGKLFDKTNLLCGASKKEEHHRTTPVLWQQKKNTTAPQTVYKLLCLSQ
jgi:hypothetical protein